MLNVSEVLKQPVVVFSKNYLPVSQINIKRAIRLLVTGKAEPIDGFKRSKAIPVHSASSVMLVPTKIRLCINHKEWVWKVPAVSRREVLRRDNHSCQYCGNTRHLTLDHVIPRSKGGRHSWDNIVTACEPCNIRKGNRTPQQAGMSLRALPKSPAHPIFSFAEQFWRDYQIHEED